MDDQEHSFWRMHDRPRMSNSGTLIVFLLVQLSL